MDKETVLAIYEMCIGGNETDFDIIEKEVLDYCAKEDEMITRLEYSNEF